MGEDRGANDPVSDNGPDVAIGEARLKLTKDFRERVAAENDAKRKARNSRRWKAERDLEEYEKQKARQRAEYSLDKGGNVRAYEAVPGDTKAERQANRLARDAARKKAKRQQADQKTKDRDADRKFALRKRNEGWDESSIAQAIERRIADRRFDRLASAEYEEDPDFGVF